MTDEVKINQFSFTRRIALEWDRVGRDYIRRRAFRAAPMASVQFFYFMGLFYTYTTDFSAWYAGSTIFAVLVCTAFAAYGFYTSMGGQAMFRSWQLDD